MARSSSLPQLSDSMDDIPVKLMSDGRIANRNGTGVTSWIGGMSITHDGNLIAPDKIMTHIHRYASPHYNPHGHHYHRWNHEPGGSEDPLYATKTVYGPGYIDENRMYGVGILKALINLFPVCNKSQFQFDICSTLKKIKLL